MAESLEAAGHYLIYIEDISVCFSCFRVILQSLVKY
jgi:hypothetical protein